MREAKNPWVGVNYLNDNTKMAVPPAFWLQRLYDFDAELVVFPSRYVPYAYVLARRRRITNKAWDQALAETITQPDTRLCLSRGLVPVTMIYRYNSVAWSIDNIIESLRKRDLWAVGGGEKAADLIEAAEAKDTETERKKVRDDMYARSGQAWESYKRRTGQRVTSPGMGSERHVTQTGSSSRTPRSGLVLTDI